MNVILRIAILSHLSDAQINLEVGRPERVKTEINFAIKALGRYPEMTSEFDTTLSLLKSAMELGVDSILQINQAKKLISITFNDLKLDTEELDEIYYED